MTIDEMYDYLHETCGVSNEALDLVICIHGYSESTMSDILYAVTGYHSFDQLDLD